MQFNVPNHSAVEREDTFSVEPFFLSTIWEEKGIQIAISKSDDDVDDVCV